MIIRCAWCEKPIGKTPPFGGRYDKEVADGICDDCLNKYFPHIADKVRECLEVEKIEQIYTEEHSPRYSTIQNVSKGPRFGSQELLDRFSGQGRQFWFVNYLCW